MKRVVVAILNYNGKDFLQKFLPGIIQYSSAVADIVVIDNASTDQSVQLLTSDFPSVKIIRLAENTGYAGGYNRGLKELNYEFLLLLNSDIEVRQGWLEPLVMYMDKNLTVGSVQPKILSYKNQSQFEHAGACGGFIDRFGYPFCRGRIMDNSEEDKGQYNTTMKIFWSTGACMMVRKQAFDKAGGFDDDFFAHMEEIDLCWRMQYLGFEIGVEPASVVYHVGGGTLSYLNPRKTYLNFRNNLFLIHKNYFDGNLCWFVIRRMKIDGIAAFMFLIYGKPKHFWAVFKAHMHYYGKLSTLKKKRRVVKQMVQHKTLTGWYKRSIVWQYFIKKKRKFSEIEEQLGN
ncbi:MAG: glycosyltransferase family 2 protein [Flavobacteriales bacterium]